MHITIIQVVIMLFALFAWSRAMLRLKDNAINISEFSFWSLIWSFVIIIALFPSLLGSISNIVGIDKGLNLVVYSSIILLFYLMFRLYVKIDTQTKETTKLVREIAINNAKKKK
jgi:small membrane protein